MHRQWLQKKEAFGALIFFSRHKGAWQQVADMEKQKNENKSYSLPKII